MDDVQIRLGLKAGKPVMYTTYDGLVDVPSRGAIPMRTRTRFEIEPTIGTALVAHHIRMDELQDHYRES